MLDRVLHVPLPDRLAVEKNHHERIASGRDAGLQAERGQRLAVELLPVRPKVLGDQPSRGIEADPGLDQQPQGGGVVVGVVRGLQDRQRVAHRSVTAQGPGALAQVQLDPEGLAGVQHRFHPQRAGVAGR